MRILGFDTKSLIKDLAISIIGIIIVTLFTKIMHVLPIVGKSIAKIIPAIICSQAATMTEYYLLNYFLIVFIVCALFAGGVFYVSRISAKIRENVEIKKIVESKGNNICEQTLENQLDNLENKITELENKLDETVKLRQKNNMHDIFGYIVSFIYSLFVLFFFCIMFFIPYSYKHSFDLAIKKITPYTTIETIQRLQSDWTMMKTYKDYSEIQNTIIKIEENNNLKR